MSRHAGQYGNGNGPTIGNAFLGDVEPAAERRLMFVRDETQWELDRQSILERLSRHGFTDADRMCISVALDDAVTFALDHGARGDNHSAAMVAYSLSSQLFHVRIRLVGGAGDARGAHRDSKRDDRDRWLLAMACMSRVQLTEEGDEIDMWRESSVGLHEIDAEGQYADD